jgi:hypothetical protein
LQRAIEHNENEIILDKRNHENISLRLFSEIFFRNLDNSIILVNKSTSSDKEEIEQFANEEHGK